MAPVTDSFGQARTQKPSRIRRLLLAQAAALLALVSAMFGYVLADVLGVLDSGRDPVPLFVLGALALAGAGFAAGRLELTVAEHGWVLLPWLVLVYGLVSFGTGLALPDALFVSWFVGGASALVLPWITGALLARLVRRT